jgi:trk system potassium uptake protein TrkH
MLRLGIIFKALAQDVKIIILSERAVVMQRIHHIKEIFVEDKLVRTALAIALLYILLYVLGALVGMWFRYPLMESLFESTSAAANVGLSCGITSARMPAALKVTYILQMWAGRLEFMSVLTLMGVVWAVIKDKR